MKLTANEMLFINSAEARLERARQIITGGGSPATLAKHFHAAADFLHKAADLLARRVKEGK